MNSFEKLDFGNIGLFELIIWGLSMYLFLYVGFAGIDQFENNVYNFVELIIG